MKDNNLEKQFDEYFKGVNIADDITADAKKSVERKRKTMPKILKFASIAASIVLVFAVALTVILKTDFNKASSENNMASGGNGGSGNDFNQSPGWSGGPNSGSAGGDNSGDSDHSGGNSGGAAGGDSEGGDSEGDAPQSGFYNDSDLDISEESASSLPSIDPALKFFENLPASANIESCSAGYMNGELALVTAYIVDDVKEVKTTAYVEFTEADVIYSGLAVYFKGEKSEYNGARYYLTQTDAINGTESKLLIVHGGAKYYFDIFSTDEKAYKEYLKLIIK